MKKRRGDGKRKFRVRRRKRRNPRKRRMEETRIDGRIDKVMAGRRKRFSRGMRMQEKVEKVRKRKLVYLERSPDYCRHNQSLGFQVH